MTRFTEIPEEIRAGIFNFFTMEELARIEPVCKTFQSSIVSHPIWIRKTGKSYQGIKKSLKIFAESLSKMAIDYEKGDTYLQYDESKCITVFKKLKQQVKRSNKLSKETQEELIALMFKVSLEDEIILNKKRQHKITRIVFKLAEGWAYYYTLVHSKEKMHADFSDCTTMHLTSLCELIQTIVSLKFAFDQKRLNMTARSVLGAVEQSIDTAIRFQYSNRYHTTKSGYNEFRNPIYQSSDNVSMFKHVLRIIKLSIQLNSKQYDSSAKESVSDHITVSPSP